MLWIAEPDEIRRQFRSCPPPCFPFSRSSATGFDDWVGHNKVTFLHKDALALTPGDFGDSRADYLYVDIWPELADPGAVTETRAIQDVVNARSVGWWGQELDFIEWAFHYRSHGHAVTVDDLRAFAEACGLAIGERSEAYVQACRAAAAVYATYGSLSFAIATRERLSAGAP